MMEERRRFVRHPIGIPLTFKVLDNDRYSLSQTTDLSDFGISFLTDEKISDGQVIEIHLNSTKTHLHAKAIVRWQIFSKEENKYRVGVMFIDRQDGFRAKMIEQICHIDMYRSRKMHEEKREIPYNEAAFEWINHYGKSFSEGNIEYNWEAA
jgi:hypothetical protein